jgi:hypothetical protein
MKRPYNYLLQQFTFKPAANKNQINKRIRIRKIENYFGIAYAYLSIASDPDRRKKFRRKKSLHLIRGDRREIAKNSSKTCLNKT